MAAQGSGTTASATGQMSTGMTGQDGMNSTMAKNLLDNWMKTGQMPNRKAIQNINAN